MAHFETSRSSKVPAVFQAECVPFFAAGAVAACGGRAALIRMQTGVWPLRVLRMASGGKRASASAGDSTVGTATGALPTVRT